ncbi:MAG: dethiobiotin synthase [Planctomycetes bacterium]|nr:dethiobiotin synthase [Planctomycetota bacterium]
MAETAAPWDVSAWPPLPATRGVFVTATDTAVGKTMIAGAIAAHLRDGGRRVGAFKPAASGCWMDGGVPVSGDAAFLAACAGDAVVPLTFAEPLAPNVAAARAGGGVDVGAILAAYRPVAARSECMVVEGVGGLLCPIADDFWVIHLAMLCRLPLVIVARPGLGTINHTLLTLHAARSAGLEVAGVVVNRYPEGAADAATATNVEQIARRGRVEVLAVVPDDPAASVADGRLGAAVREAIAAVDWMRWA